MPFTLPLRRVPPPPAAQAPLVDDKGRPTQQFYEWVAATTAWMTAAHAALEQVEP